MKSTELITKIRTLRNAARDMNQVAMQLGKELNVRGKVIYDYLKKLGIVKSGFTFDGLSYDFHDNKNDETWVMQCVNLKILQEGGDSAFYKGIQHISIPSKWVLCDDDSYKPAAREMAKKIKEKEQKRSKIRELNKEISSLRKNK